MQYFSLHTPQGTHLGFFIMLPDNEQERYPQTGRFIVKLQSEQPSLPASLLAALADYQNPDVPLYWTVQQDHVNLFDTQHQPIGTIRNEYLTLNGQSFLLHDMTGLM